MAHDDPDNLSTRSKALATGVFVAKKCQEKNWQQWGLESTSELKIWILERRVEETGRDRNHDRNPDCLWTHHDSVFHTLLLLLAHPATPSPPFVRSICTSSRRLPSKYSTSPVFFSLKRFVRKSQIHVCRFLCQQVEFGIGKNVVETFPTIKACELKCTASEDSQWVFSCSTLVRALFFLCVLGWFTSVGYAESQLVSPGSSDSMSSSTWDSPPRNWIPQMSISILNPKPKWVEWESWKSICLTW